MRSSHLPSSTAVMIIASLSYASGAFAQPSSVDPEVAVSSGEETQDRVRTQSTMLATLIRVAAERSPTFRALVAVIDATDGIVYVPAGRCDRVRACLLHRIAGTGSRRVLTIVVDTKRDEVSVMAAIAHELQHAAEVLTNVAIKTDEEMFALLPVPESQGTWRSRDRNRSSGWPRIAA